MAPTTSIADSIEAPAAPRTIDASTLEALEQSIHDYLGQEIYSCGRVYSAWSYGTMGLDDFSLAQENPEIIDSIVDIALEKLGFVRPAAAEKS